MRKKSENFKIVGQWDKTHNYQWDQLVSLSHLLSHFNSAWDNGPDEYEAFEKTEIRRQTPAFAVFGRPNAAFLIGSDDFRANCVK